LNCFLNLTLAIFFLTIEHQDDIPAKVAPKGLYFRVSAEAWHGDGGRHHLPARRASASGWQVPVKTGRIAKRRVGFVFRQRGDALSFAFKRSHIDRLHHSGMSRMHS
jgi:hypothetical protein